MTFNSWKIGCSVKRFTEIQVDKANILIGIGSLSSNYLIEIFYVIWIKIIVKTYIYGKHLSFNFKNLAYLNLTNCIYIQTKLVWTVKTLPPNIFSTLQKTHLGLSLRSSSEGVYVMLHNNFTYTPLVSGHKYLSKVNADLNA